MLPSISALLQPSSIPERTLLAATGATGLLVVLLALYLSWSSLSVYWRFFYACFLKPFDHGGVSGGKSTGQQAALESFYRSQAGIYDTTRATLLRGREDMLRLAAAQLKHRAKGGQPKPIWVDIGGGTGYNIEKMNAFVTVAEFFSVVYLVDLSPSLCSVARQRFAALGWKNVHVVCEDARTFSFDLTEKGGARRESDGRRHQTKADYISMSYSLSMIPDFYSVLDSMADLLAPLGVISCVDFHVQSASSYSLRTFTGGHHLRHVNWLSRFFWRNWFRFDRVHLDEGRRDYLEHRFGTILNVNGRNYKLGGIPYYVWLGCQRSATSAAIGALGREAAERIDAIATESPYLSPICYAEAQRANEVAATQETKLQLRSKGFEAAILNLATNVPLPSFFFQNERWRLYYDETLPKHTQFGNEYIYAFTWEDPAEDQRLLNIGSDDVVFAITSAGDNILAYALQRPRSIHAVDLNPSQNHLLELKAAAFRALSCEDVWRLFGAGRHPTFRTLLLDKLSPHLSSRALQFWLDNIATFTSAGGLYETGGTRLAVKLTRWLVALCGLQGHVRALCAAQTIEDQALIWRKRLRPVVLSKLLSYCVLAKEQFLWRALGVPPNQRDMILADAPDASRHRAMWNYVVDTLDPVAQQSLLSRENYFYRLCLTGRYSEECHPAYLSAEAHATLSAPGAFDGLRIHTDEFVEVLARIKSHTVTAAIIMDHMDWFDVNGDAATREVRALNHAMKLGGRVLLRSAGLRPWYIDTFTRNGFKCRQVNARKSGTCVDRVNMYASTWICTKVEPITPKVVRLAAGLEAVESFEL